MNHIICGIHKLTFFILITIEILVSLNQPHADDTELFMTQVPPDTLILLDMSGSMNWDPAGNPASYPNRRIDIARKVIFDLLDDNDDNKIDTNDEKSLDIRFGYMRFWSSSDNDDGDPKNGSILVPSGADIGSSHSNIWNLINDWRDGSGGTPLAASLVEAKTYFTNWVNPGDTAIACREKFVILITDGEDTYACSGDGTETQPNMFRRRVLTVQRAKELYDAGIKVFVVGFGGTVSDSLKRALNWAAKSGGTDNPLETNSGNPTAYDVTKYGDACATTDINADPANYPLSGYTFLAVDASELSKALKAIAKNIQEKSFCFAAPTVPAVRIIDKDVAYLSSFIPDETPFWKGNLKAYRLNKDGTLPVDKEGFPLNSNLIWDAFEKLKVIAPNSRKIYSYVNNALTSFEYNYLTNADLGVLLDSDRANLINHIRGIDAYDADLDGNTTETREWKLGDIFHSNAVIVGEPSRFFEDECFAKCPNGTIGFYQKNKDRPKVIIVGANDGMLHAFDVATGDECWAFIPDSLLKNLQMMISTHTYYVDSSPKVADVWFYSSPAEAKKNTDEWKTVLVCGLRKGGKTYFALDITDTLNPKYLWGFPKPNDAAILGIIGQSWSEPAIGRVKVEVAGGLYERWVAFIGGGFDHTNNAGKAFFVIDIKTGEVIKEFSGMEGMNYSLAAPPTAIDTNADGYVEKIYIGDLGGQMWVFDISSDEYAKKSNSEWSAKLLFKPRSTEKHPIYYQPAVAFDRHGKPWIYFGTGDREHPKDLSNPAERLYAIKDDGLGNYPRTETDLSDVTTSNTFNPTSTTGWYIQLEKSPQRSEKVLGKPAVFNQLVYFTSYTYTQMDNACSVLGEAKLYIVEYLSGGGALGLNDLSDLRGIASQRSKIIGTGIPSPPIVRVDLRGKATVTIGSTSAQIFSKETLSPSTTKQILYWRELSQ